MRQSRSRPVRAELPGSELPAINLKREMRCPRCLAIFETPRRWQLVCPDCGHEWEEKTELTFREHLADFSVAEVLGMGVMWLIVGFALAVVIVPVILLYYYLHMSRTQGILLVALLLGTTLAGGIWYGCQVDFWRQPAKSSRKVDD
ncbi:MAG TPA: hypothetical protein VI759_00585 [Dehalococcoidia bacterium]|nr:hypothetical protein [Dehalococcoidia bacterium]